MELLTTDCKPRTNVVHAIRLVICLAMCGSCTENARQHTDLPIAELAAKRECDDSAPVNLLSITANGAAPLWRVGAPFPVRGRLGDEIIVTATHLCDFILTVADGITPAVPADYRRIDETSIGIVLPWNRPRIENSLVFRKGRSFTRIDLRFLPIDDMQRQLYILGLRAESF